MGRRKKAQREEIGEGEDVRVETRLMSRFRTEDGSVKRRGDGHQPVPKPAACPAPAADPAPAQPPPV